MAEQSIAWILKGERVGLSAPERGEFVERWRLFNDPVLAWLFGYQTTVNSPMAPSMPPFLREQREGHYERMLQRDPITFDIRLLSDGRCIGEASWRRIGWPAASADLALAIYLPEDRGQGYGSEAAPLMAAYAIDVLGLHRLTFRSLSVNEGVAGALAKAGERYGVREVGVEKEALWAFGRFQDLRLGEVLARDFPPHPATAHLRQA